MELPTVCTLATHDPFLPDSLPHIECKKTALAKKIGVSQTFIAQLKTGAENNPTLDTLTHLAKALQVKLSTLVD